MSDTIEACLATVDRWLRVGASKGADLLLFPEMMLTRTLPWLPGL
ncbi:MAG: hypothetical protein AB1505_32930 [Candidatus Latescibacterota bacterium]